MGIESQPHEPVQEEGDEITGIRRNPDGTIDRVDINEQKKKKGEEWREKQ
jgi:hypothetical protein